MDFVLRMSEHNQKPAVLFMMCSFCDKIHLDMQSPIERSNRANITHVNDTNDADLEDKKCEDSSWLR